MRHCLLYFVFSFYHFIMAATEKSLLSCKKIGDSHEKPINSKCDRAKLKEEKRDTSHEHTV